MLHMADTAYSMVIRELTLQESTLLEKRRAGFQAFLEERMPVLTDFVQRLALHDPALVLVDAERYLPSLDQWLKDQLVDSTDRVWLLTRLGYFIGEYLVQRHGGCWLLNEIPDSTTFGRYVVGRFVKVSNRSAMFDPFAIADDCISCPPGRSLISLLSSVEIAIAQA